MKSEFSNRLRLFWVSVILLFLELLIIRWLSSEIRIFAYFHNLVLIICFLGIGIGCARPKRTSSFVIPILLLGLLAFYLYSPVNLGIFSVKKITVYLGNIKDFVLWYPTFGAREVWELPLGIAMLGVLTIAIVYLFIPFGELLGQLLSETDRPIRAYTINILGSLFGILLFTLLSYLSSPPAIWLTVFFIFFILLLILENERKVVVPFLIVAVIIVGFVFIRGGEKLRQKDKSPASWGSFSIRRAEKWDVWSPYQKLEIMPLDVMADPENVSIGYLITVNGVPYQAAKNLSDEFIKQNQHIGEFSNPDKVKFNEYNFPYNFFPETLDNVLIVGAGTGNDVAAALRHGAKHIDAVEIDPKIIDLGRKLHPEQPYSSERVAAINDDARSFFHRASKQYDLIIFGLLDSHTLSSSLSNVRLDNYVYTLQSIKEARQLLKPGGVVVLIFCVSDDFIGQSLYRIMTAAFGAPPLCSDLSTSSKGWRGLALVGGNREVISQTLHESPFLQSLINTSYESGGAEDLVPTDDWPYLYLDDRSIPSLYYIVFALLVLISAMLVRRGFNGLGVKGIDWHFFFLGAGFLLIEVQNVSKLALLFGSTWIVNSIVFSAILVMILLANYYVSLAKIRSLAPYYVGLAIVLITIYFFPLGKIASFAPIPKAAISGLLLSLPIFFAGIIFAHSFRGARQLNRVFASNLVGAMIGGMLESMSFIFGIKALLILAMILYGLSYISRNQQEAP